MPEDICMCRYKVVILVMRKKKHTHIHASTFTMWISWSISSSMQELTNSFVMHCANAWDALVETLQILLLT